MKKLLLLLPMWAIISIIVACTQDSVMDTEVEKQLEELENALSENCTGCLPIITVKPCSTSNGEIQITFKAKEESVNHHFDLYCQMNTGQNRQTFTFWRKDEQQTFSTRSTEYIYYSISCKNCPLGRCVTQGSYKLNNGRIEESVGYKECFKQYKEYETLFWGHDSKLTLNPKYNDPTKIMDVNSGRVFITDEYGTRLYKDDIKVILNDTNKVVEVYDLPLIRNTTIRVELYNKMGCPDHDAHYLSMTYTYKDGEGIKILSELTEVDKHGPYY